MFHKDFLKLFTPKIKGKKGQKWRCEIPYLVNPDQNGNLLLEEPANTENSGLRHVMLQNVPVNAIALHMDFAQHTFFGEVETGSISAILQTHRCDYCVFYENMGQKLILFIELKTHIDSKTAIAKKIWGAKTIVEYLFSCHNDLYNTAFNIEGCKVRFWQIYMRVKKTTLDNKQIENTSSKSQLAYLSKIAVDIQNKHMQKSGDVIDLKELIQ